MRITTREMGIVEVPTSQLLNFVGPILGFESHRMYAILPAHSAPPFHWLQSVEESNLAFPIVPAQELGIQYNPKDLLGKVGATSAKELAVWIIAVLPRDGSPLRLNLRAPVIVNTRRGLAAQVILREEYPVSCTLNDCRQEAAGRSAGRREAKVRDRVLQPA